MTRGYPDWSGPKVGVYLQPEWAAKEGIDKNFRGGANNKTYGQGADVLYQVPAGKTLYITLFCVSQYATNAADADNNQMCQGYIWNQTTDMYPVICGGNGGISISLSKPVVVNAGEAVYFCVANMANHACNIIVIALGYEI